MEGRLKGSTPQIKFSEEKVQQLTELGFKCWVAKNERASIWVANYEPKNERTIRISLG